MLSLRREIRKFMDKKQVKRRNRVSSPYCQITISQLSRFFFNQQYEMKEQIIAMGSVESPKKTTKQVHTIDEAIEATRNYLICTFFGANFCHWYCCINVRWHRYWQISGDTDTSEWPVFAGRPNRADESRHRDAVRQMRFGFVAHRTGPVDVNVVFWHFCDNLFLGLYGRRARSPEGAAYMLGRWLSIRNIIGVCV